jgi:ankyrin repeat protein
VSEERVYEDIRPPYCYHVFDDELSDEAKIVMLRIMRRINENQSVNISFLAEELGEDPFTVRSCLVELAEQGLDLCKKDRYGDTAYHIERR